MKNQTAIEQLNTQEQTIVLCAMQATAANVDDAEKHARLGITPDELARFIAAWPLLGNDENAYLAVNNSLNEVCYGFGMEPGDWSKWFDVRWSKCGGHTINGSC